MGRGLHGRADLEDPHLARQLERGPARPMAAEGIWSQLVTGHLRQFVISGHSLTEGHPGRHSAGDGAEGGGRAQAGRRQQLLLLRRLRPDRAPGMNRDQKLPEINSGLFIRFRHE